MNKVIAGKVYDTEKAKAVGSTDNGRAWMDLDYYGETLHRKRTGEYFLHQEGGARSLAAESRDGGTIGGERIVPVTFDEARQWAEQNMDADEYAEAFGMPEDGAASLYVTSVPASAKAKLERESQRTGKTQAQIVTELLESL